MEDNYRKIKEYVLELNYTVTYENETEGTIAISNESEGIQNMLLVCTPPILIMEQFLVDVKKDDTNTWKRLLQKNRDIIHGAMVLDESGKRLIFRDTLQVENLDLNELEGSINSLSLLLSEFSNELISISKN
jgi:hypothetical protein